MMRGIHSVLGFGLLLMVVACGGSTPGARSANDEDASSEDSAGKKSHDDPSWYDNGSDSSDTPKSAASSTPSSKKKSKRSEGDPPEPTFKEGMSVNDAVNAIPQGYERMEIEQEALNQPLMNQEVYKSCKLAASQHFEIKYAVWDGRAVGMDIKTMPNNKNAETCLRGLVKGIVWRDKVHSLNIGTVQF